MGDIEQNNPQVLLDSAPVKLYVNGFTNIVGSADVVSVLNQNGRVVASINMSYTTAKSFADMLHKVVSDFEQKMGQEIMTIESISKKLTKKHEEPSH